MFDDALTLWAWYKLFLSSYGDSSFSWEKKYDQKDIPFAIRILENPAYRFIVWSWELFPWRTTLRHHDMLHVLLNRKAHLVDEAVVIGMTMWSTKKMTPRQTAWFIRMTNLLAPQQYHYNKVDAEVFKASVNYAHEHIDVDLSILPFDLYLDQALGSLRKLYRLESVADFYAALGV